MFASNILRAASGATKAAKTAPKAAAKPKVATSAKPKAAAQPKAEKVLEVKEGTGFKEATARTLANEHKLSLTTANAIQNHVFNAMKTSLAKTGRVAIPGLGVFRVGVRAARKGRNPKTGDALDIPAANTIRFRATPVWKEEVQKFKVPAKTPKAAKAAK